MSSSFGGEGSNKDVGGGGGHQQHPFRNGGNRPCSSSSLSLTNCPGGGGVGDMSSDPSPNDYRHHHHKEREKVGVHETVVNMMSMLTLGIDEGGRESKQSVVDNQRMVLLNMANTPDSCLTLRRAGCIPLLVDLIHPPSCQPEEGVRTPEIIQVRAAKALKNIVQFNPDEKEKRKEVKVLRLLEGIRLFSEAVKGLLKKHGGGEQEKTENIQHPTQSLGALMKLSFDEEHKRTMCILGAVHALAEVVVSDHMIHGNDPNKLKEDCIHLRRLAAKALTNLTVSDKRNKALLCGMKEFLVCLVRQLDCENEDICHSSACVLRNLSWNVDSASKLALSDVSPCSRLMDAAMKTGRELTLKASLAAIWNLSTQTPSNTAEICGTNDAVPFLLSLMKPNSSILKQMEKPRTIIEQASGILSRISSYLAKFPEIRKLLRDNRCYEILLEHLKCDNMMVVGNACEALSRLSGPENEEDQRTLLHLNAIPMLKSLVYSKDKRIQQGSSMALRNLLSSKFAKECPMNLDSRLSAQIYISSDLVQRQAHSSGSGSESDHDNEYTSGSMQPNGKSINYSQPMAPPPSEPPAAHQHSTASAVSVFQNRSLVSHGSSTTDYRTHNHPAMSLPLHQGMGYRNSSSVICYSDPDAEPLDLSLASAKSSPIHVISAAEFGNMGRHMNQQHANVEPRNMPFHQYAQTNLPNRNSVAGRTPGRNIRGNPASGFAFSGGNFNRSCPEILSRFQQGFTAVPQHANQPLDFSHHSTSATSSLQGGGEGAATDSILIDSNSDRDTTFNFSLRFAENDGEDEPVHHSPAITKSEDTVTTYCYEGTPQTFSKANSCQDLVNELEEEGDNSKLQPIDEVKPYHVENTPAVFSRASSLSSIHSADEAGNVANNNVNDGQETEQTDRSHSSDVGMRIRTPPQPMPRKRNSQSYTPCRVTFSAEETPLMFSRCSSVDSLNSLEPTEGAHSGHRNDDELSDYSRRESEVVSPSELPDSPQPFDPPVRNDAQKGEEDTVKVFTVEEKSGFNSCRSLSPLTVDGEELAVLGKHNNLRSIPDPSHSVNPVVGDISGPDKPLSSPKQVDRMGDEVKVFNVEGTPFYGVSNATSLSDLMGDLEDGEESKRETNVVMNQGSPQTTSKVAEVEKAALALVMEDNGSGENTNDILTEQDKDETAHDAQLLEKCIRVGKSLGLPKSQSEFKIGSNTDSKIRNSKTSENVRNGVPSSKQKSTCKSQDFEFDDPELAALIQIGRNRTTDKDKANRSKYSKRSDKSKSQGSTAGNSNSDTVKVELQLELSPKVSDDSHSNNELKTPVNEESHSLIENEGEQRIQTQSRLEKEDSLEFKSTDESSAADSSNSASDAQQKDAVNSKLLGTDPMQISIMSVGSEWNDETPTLSSPIPSMSMSTAFRLAQSVDAESLSVDKADEVPIEINHISVSMNNSLQVYEGNMEESCLSILGKHEPLDNIDPPSSFSNLVSSTDCIGSPQLLQKSNTSSISDKLNKRWKALTDAANNSSVSNLSRQQPPPDFDMENSIISIASIKSEIYESSSASFPNEAFESAVEDLEQKEEQVKQVGGDNSIGGNTYTIFPPENANRLSGVRSNDLSDGKITVVSEDFTDAEDIDDFETAPLAESLADEKVDEEKTIHSPEKRFNVDEHSSENAVLKSPEKRLATSKPLMEVRPLKDSSDNNKYNTYVVKKASPSPRSSPRQKRRDDPERYRTHTINPLNIGKAFISDANGNPDLKFTTYRVGGPKIVKVNSNNVNLGSDTSNSPSSTPGNSPKGIRGRRKHYSSLPPSAIIRNQNHSTNPPPIPPKPSRTASPTSSTGVFVRPTRTSELRIAANNARDGSPRRNLENPSSRNSSNSSLNHISCSSRASDISVSSRPKVAPKPPTRTTPSITCMDSHAREVESPSVPIQIRTSTSSFGFGQYHAPVNVELDSNVKGYSTLPKSSKLGPHIPFSLDRSGRESPGSNHGSEKSAKSIGKITNLWKKMDFRGSKQETKASSSASNTENKKHTSGKSKLSNLFGRGKKDKPTPTTTSTAEQHQPFRMPLPIHPDSAGNNFATDLAPASMSSRPGVRRDGDKKVIVSQFNSSNLNSTATVSPQTRTSKITTV